MTDTNVQQFMIRPWLPFIHFLRFAKHFDQCYIIFTDTDVGGDRRIAPPPSAEAMYGDEVYDYAPPGRGRAPPGARKAAPVGVSPEGYYRARGGEVYDGESPVLVVLRRSGIQT